MKVLAKLVNAAGVNTESASRNKEDADAREGAASV